MAGTTMARLFLALVVGYGFGGEMVDSAHAGRRNPQFDAGKAYRTEVSIVTKRFWIALRDNSGKKMRSVLDPEYLTQHKIDSEGVAFPGVDTMNLSGISITADRSIVMCRLKNRDGGTSIVLLRLVKRGDRLFIQPASPPAGTSHRVVPWLLLEKATA